MAVEKLIGKDIRIRGTIKGGTEIDVAWVGEKKVWDSSSERERRTKSQAIGAVGQPVGAINEPGPGRWGAARVAR